MRERVDTECLERGEENEHGRPAVVQREREVHPDWKGNSSQRQHVLWRETTRTFVVEVLAGMVLLDDVVDVRDSRADEQREDESDDIVLLALWACAASGAESHISVAYAPKHRRRWS